MINIFSIAINFYNFRDLVKRVKKTKNCKVHKLEK